jgi:hypothetical protein
MTTFAMTDGVLARVRYLRGRVAQLRAAFANASSTLPSRGRAAGSGARRATGLETRGERRKAGFGQLKRERK